jgi:phage recombination protein Bet
VYRGNKPITLEEKQVALIRDLCAKGTNDQEFELFMQVCRKSKLDPFLRQIYCVLWPKDNGRTHEMVIITGIGGYRAMAARDHNDFGGTSAATFSYFDPPSFTPAGKRIPESATVTAFRKGGIQSTGSAYWEEYAPADLRKPRSDFWNRMPKVMLEKCAEAKALRKAFPGLSNIFTPEEMDHRFQDVTPQGRQISIAGVAPSGAIVDPRAAAKVAQQAVLDEKLNHGHPEGSAQAKTSQATLERVEAEDRRLLQAKDVTPKPIPTSQPVSTAKSTPIATGAPPGAFPGHPCYCNLVRDRQDQEQCRSWRRPMVARTIPASTSRVPLSRSIRSHGWVWYSGVRRQEGNHSRAEKDRPCLLRA